MLPRLFLVLMQIWAALYIGPMILRLDFIPSLGNLQIFLQAVIFAILVWLVGHVGGLVLKNVSSPTPTTLSYALVGALILAALVFFLPIEANVAKFTGINIQTHIYVLLGAIAGYSVHR